LLRIAAGAGVGAMVGVAACSSDSGMGSIANQPGDDASMDGTVPGPCGGGPCGVVAVPEDASDEDVTNPCASHPCGIVPVEDAAADAADGGASTDAGADGEPDASGPCGGGVCGVVPIPHDAGEDASLLHCPPVCGVVVNPGH
jgi:hypothetical protein